MVPAVVLSGPIRRSEPIQNDADAIGPVYPLVSGTPNSPSQLLPPSMNPGPVVWENLPAPTEQDKTPAGIVNMPGPAIPEEAIPEVKESEDRSERQEKRSEDITSERPAWFNEALHRVPVSRVEADEAMFELRAFLGGVNPDDIAEEGVRKIYWDAKEMSDKWYAA